jgi:uncharacterized protein YcnI
MTKNTFARAATAGVATTLLVGASIALGAPLSASAHVRIDPAQADPGSYTTVTFKVPTESATASTTTLTVDLPTDTPFTSVSYQPVPGWSTTVVTAPLPEPIRSGDATITEAPVSVVWTADPGAGIEPGQFQEFPLSLGPVPDTGSVLLPAHQGYSDGSVVDWADPTPASGEEPEHPAPTLYITDAPPVEEAAPVGSDDATDADDTDVALSSSGDTAGTAAGTATQAAASASLALGFGIGGLVLGAAALVLSAVVLLRRPARAAAAAAAGAAGQGAAHTDASSRKDDTV